MHLISEAVLKMYRAQPFPQWTHEERHHQFWAELSRYRYLGLEGAMPGARFLDVGCGTGDRSMLAAKHYGVAEFVGFDFSEASLNIAKKVADKEGFDRFTPVQGNLFELPFDDGSFDVVVSWGVLHHTENPRAGFREMVRVCKPGGYVGLYLYNAFNHWRHNFQKGRVSRRGGDDVERRFAVAHLLYGTTPVAQMSPQDIAIFYDQYCHPHKSDHTLGEMVRWFEEEGLSYWGSYPALRMRDALGCLQYRAELRERWPLRQKRFNQLLDAVSALRGVNANPSGPYRRPTLMHRGVWQAIYAWMGRRGDYSGGSALAARKLA